MRHQYDWSKLDAGWSVNGPDIILAPSAKHCGRAFRISSVEEHNHALKFWPEARAQLAKCRVVDNAPLFEAMDKMASEAESATQYNWSKLEGTGWREGNGAFITNGKFNYWYTLGDRPKLEAFDKFHGNDALQAELSAAAAMELCRIDWKEEVAEAIDGTGLQMNRVGRGDGIMCIGNALNVDEHRRMRLLSPVRLDIEKLLALSVVIERLKKLGWRES